ncbi:MAG: cytochrome C biogenesis protein [Spirochaetes bacterium GWB1_59_5]|nr:MAG: cytochrome C biogenesis protein [Spirochaetes bacterium GWB1_59_5]
MTATLAFAILAVALAVQAVFLFGKSAKPDSVTPWLLSTAGLLLLATTVLRSFAISFVAITSVYESLVVLAATTSLALAVYRFKSRNEASKALLFGGTFVAFFFLVLTSSPLAPSVIKPPVPALQSAWLVLHVTCTFLGEAMFALGFVSAILQLTARSEEKRSMYDRLTYTSVAIGYPLFTAGALVFGAIWAEAAWGRWWSWDPKETWALITWLTYTLYMHFRLIRKNRSKLLPALVILGFIVALFTFFGVNFLLPGLHSYA